MSERKAVTKAKATAYAQASRAQETQILHELVELTGGTAITPERHCVRR